MNRLRYFINIETPRILTTAQKTKLLAEFRNALCEFRNTHPELDITVSREFTSEELTESLREDLMPDADNCVFYDEAQGRHKCTNPKVKSNRCHGMCNNYEDKP